jgi:endogenous inhibitor of DNA gyrase (YacG/DUF329 family)
MNAQMKSEETPKECAACGKPISQSANGHREFCDRRCRAKGRAFCKACGNVLQQPTGKGGRKTFCDELCQKRYYAMGSFISPSLLAERERLTCKACGNPLPPAVKGHVRFYCSDRCSFRYRYVSRQQRDIKARWGTFAHETRKILCELEDRGEIGTARRLATAIDREYVLRISDVKRSRMEQYVKCRCKTCGNDFYRMPHSLASKDYCNGKCQPLKRRSGELGSAAKLSWEDIDEIRKLYASGRITQKALGERYSVTYGTIGSIISYRTWKPENDLRKHKDITPYTSPLKYLAVRKLTWEQVDEIRMLSATGQFTQAALGAKYGISDNNIRNIIHCRTWKPEHDPRRKENT